MTDPISEGELETIRRRDKYADDYCQEVGRPMDGPTADRRTLLFAIDIERAMAKRIWAELEKLSVIKFDDPTEEGLSGEVNDWWRDSIKTILAKSKLSGADKGGKA